MERIFRLMRKCKYCNSKDVVWNWIYSPFWRTWLSNFYRTPKYHWKFWRYFHRWGHACWNCGDGGEVQFTFFKVRNGIDYEVLKKTFVHLPKHNLPEIRNQLGWMVDQCKHFYDKPHDRRIWNKRKKQLLDLIKQTLDKQWKLDHN